MKTRFNRVGVKPLCTVIIESEIRLLERELKYLRKASMFRSLTRQETYRKTALENCFAAREAEDSFAA